MVYARLARRLRARGLKDFASYRKLLDNDDGEELGLFVNALTTNLTAFFREAHHFEHLAEVLEAHRGRALNIWSAGCSSGEEPYSIAMTVLERPAAPFPRNCCVPAMRHWWSARRITCSNWKTSLSMVAMSIYSEHLLPN